MPTSACSAKIWIFKEHWKMLPKELQAMHGLVDSQFAGLTGSWCPSLTLIGHSMAALPTSSQVGRECFAARSSLRVRGRQGQVRSSSNRGQTPRWRLPSSRSSQLWASLNSKAFDAITSQADNGTTDGCSILCLGHPKHVPYSLA